MDLREIGCEDGRWMELAQDRAQQQALVLVIMNLQVLLPQRYLFFTAIDTFYLYLKRATQEN